MKTNKLKKILLIGPYPPPYGGISVQLKRLKEYLDDYPDQYDCKVLNIGENREEEIDGSIPVTGYIDYVLKIIYFARRRYIFYLVTSGHNLKSWISACMCVIVGLLNQRKMILVLGSGLLPKYIDSAGFFLSRIIKFVLRFSSAIICRNIDAKVVLEQKSACMKKVFIIPGFLGVDKTTICELPDHISRFVKTHTPVIGAHAITEPEYGLPLLIEAFSDLNRMYPGIGFIIIGVSEEDMEKIDLPVSLKTNLLPAGYLPNPESLATMKSLDVFVRATYFDGDSNSIREAISLDVPVVASKTDYRPRGTILFNIGDKNDLVQMVTSVLDGSLTFDGNSVKEQAKQSIDKILRIYDSF